MLKKYMSLKLMTAFTKEKVHGTAILMFFLPSLYSFCSLTPNISKSVVVFFFLLSKQDLTWLVPASPLSLSFWASVKDFAWSETEAKSFLQCTCKRDKSVKNVLTSLVNMGLLYKKIICFRLIWGANSYLLELKLFLKGSQNTRRQMESHNSWLVLWKCLKMYQVCQFLLGVTSPSTSDKYNTQA